MYYTNQTYRSFFNDPVIHYLLLDTSENDKKLDLAYRLGFHQDVEKFDDLLMKLQNYTIGTEKITFGEWIHDIAVVLSRITNRIYKLGRIVVEDVFKKYELASRLWEDRINENIEKINDEHFREKIVKTIPLETLKQRIVVIGNIAQLLENAESIVNSPIHDIDDPNSYNTPEFINGYKQLKEIGFNLTNKTFVESKSQGYSAKTEKRRLEDHGYSKSDLPELAKMAKTVANTTSKKWLENTVQRFKNLEGKLLAYEKQTMINQAMDRSIKEEELKKVQIRLSRLWWLSNFIHLLQKLASDQMTHILHIFRAADDSVPHAIEEQSGKMYFND